MLSQRERDLLHLEPSDLLDEIDLARHVPGPPRRHAVATVRVLEPEPLEDSRLLAGRNVEAEHRVRPLGPKRDDGGLGQLRLDVGVPRPACSGQLDDQVRRHGRSRTCEVRVDALLPAVRALRPQGDPLGRPKERERVEVRRLEQH